MPRKSHYVGWFRDVLIGIEFGEFSYLGKKKIQVICVVEFNQIQHKFFQALLLKILQLLMNLFHRVS